MKLDIVSDLHLEFDSKNLVLTPKSDTLIMAGDVMEVVNLSTIRSMEFSIWLTMISSMYKNVVWVLGNHEHYFSVISETKKELQSFLDKAKLKNIHVLENETVEIEDAIVFGATMWTSIHNLNPIRMNAIQHAMNDYRYIKRYRMSSSGVLKKEKLRPTDTIDLHYESIAHLVDFAKLKTDKKKIVVSHHAPSFISIPDSFRTNMLNDAYADDLYNEYFASGIALSVHGHIHQPVDYLLSRTRVVSNPRGYFGQESVQNYDVLTVEV